MPTLGLTVNGDSRTEEVEGRLLLIYYLREVCGLTGSHVGCDTSQCGACTVLLDGEPVKSCTVLALQAQGSLVTTLEGLAPPGELHLLQRAFSQEHGLQCGYCTPGFIIAAAALLDRNPSPSRDQISRGLEGNLCRCTGYVNIRRAVAAAAAEMVGAASPPPANPPPG
ncbi:MAG: (2Fe-2S)-binding protein [Candidatus Dormibacteria bacterium]